MCVCVFLIGCVCLVAREQTRGCSQTFESSDDGDGACYSSIARTHSVFLCRQWRHTYQQLGSGSARGTKRCGRTGSQVWLHQPRGGTYAYVCLHKSREGRQGFLLQVVKDIYHFQLPEHVYSGKSLSTPLYRVTGALKLEGNVSYLYINVQQHHVQCCCVGWTCGAAGEKAEG